MLEVFKILTGKEGLEEGTFFTRQKEVTRGHSMKLYKESLQNRCAMLMNYYSSTPR